MDDLMMIEAVERYLAGEMLPEEKAYFEQLRQSDPAIDQLVVEHAFFMQGLTRFENIRSFKHQLQEVETNLAAEGLLNVPVLTGKAKVIQLWNKYKRNMAVAASIAGFISLLTFGLTISYTQKYGNDSVASLALELKKAKTDIEKIKNQDTKTNTPLKPQPIIDFRATGFLIDGKGFLVTNAHVVNRRKHIYVENNKGEFFAAEAIYTDANADLAILKIVDTAFKAITNLPYSIKKNNADLAEQFFTLGFPRTEVVYGEGYVSAKTGSEGDTTAYQLTVSANPGNSGGPVINRNGEIIGIITGKNTQQDGVVYAAKSKNIFRLIDNLKKENDSYQSIKTPVNNSLKGLDRVQQVKKMEEFVYMVVGD